MQETLLSSLGGSSVAYLVTKATRLKEKQTDNNIIFSPVIILVIRGFYYLFLGIVAERLSLPGNYL